MFERRGRRAVRQYQRPRYANGGHQTTMKVVNGQRSQAAGGGDAETTFRQLIWHARPVIERYYDHAFTAAMRVYSCQPNRPVVS